MIFEMTKTRLAVVGALGLALLATGPANSAQAQKAVANNDEVRINTYTGSIINLPIWVATDQGFCKAHGLNCEPIDIPSAPLSLQALAAGSTEIHFSSTDVSMQSASRGNAIQIISGESPYSLFILDVRSDVPMPHLKDGYPAVMQDLKGFNIAVTARGAATEIETRALFTGAGIDPDSATYVAAGSPATAYPMFSTKQVEAAMMFEPFNTLCNVQKTCVVAVDLPAGAGPADLKALNGAFVTYVATRQYIAAHPMVIQAFNQAMAEASDWLKKPENFDGVMTIAKAHLALANIPNAEQVMRQLVKAYIPMVGVHVERNSVRAFSDFLIKYKLIENPVSPDTFVYAEAP